MTAATEQITKREQSPQRTPDLKHVCCICTDFSIAFCGTRGKGTQPVYTSAPEQWCVVCYEMNRGACPRCGT